MVKEGRTVRVWGLPLDMTENRLSDKLHIHFLRKRNGGGEISSVKVIKTTPGTACITFEDSKVAQRVVEHGNHTLLLNDKQYDLTVTLHKTEIDPNELFVDTAVTVDYSKLPGGKTAILNTRKTFPDVKFTFDLHNALCALEGPYSDVQTLTKCLLSLLDSQTTQDAQSHDTEITMDDKRYNSTQEQTENQQDPEILRQASGLDLRKCSSRASERSQTPPRASYTDDREQAGALAEEGSLEDFSMVLDSDIFQYLQKHCTVEYQSILNRHGVKVLDVNTKDITTLYLQVKKGVVGRGMECLMGAHQELGLMYQEKEAQLRKVHLAKEGLPIQGLQQAVEVLTQTFPKLLINEDKANVYLVGSGCDVSEAKQFLMDMHGTAKKHSQEWKRPIDALFCTSGASSFVPDTDVDKQLRKVGDEGKKEYKMAAKFGSAMSSGKPKDMLGSSLGDIKASEDQQNRSLFTKPDGSEGQRLGSGPMSEITGLKLGISSFSSGDLQVPNPTREDPLFKRNDPFSSYGLSDSTKTTEVSESQSFSLNYMDLSEDKSVPTVNQSKSGSTLRRSNSFSGRVRLKQDGKISSSDVFGKTQGGKTSSSFKIANSSVTSEVFSVEVVVPMPQWVYMKEIYKTDITDITSDLQMKEKLVGKDLILHLRGADAAKVIITQQELKELVAKVAKDFSTNELLLTDLGVTDSREDTGEVLCAIVRDTFEKVKITLVLKSIFILGPKHDCQKALTALKEAVHFGTENKKTWEERTVDVGIPSSATPSNPGLDTPTIHLICGKNERIDQQSTYATNKASTRDYVQQNHDYPQHFGDKQDDKESEPSYREEEPSLNKDSISNEKKQPVLKLRLGAAEPLDRKTKSTLTENQKSEASPVPSSNGNQHYGASKFGGKKEEKQTRKETDLSCVCETSGESMPMMASGVSLCPWCLDKVNPYCSKCPMSNAMDPQSANDKQYGACGFEEKQEEKKTEGESDLSCVCGSREESVPTVACGVAVCSQCKENVNFDCDVCPKSEENITGIRGTISYSELSFSLLGHSKYTTMKITYIIPDGVQGKDHPNPGAPFQGGRFDAFLPLNETTRRLLPSLERAFHQCLTFCVRVGDNRVTWGVIPHKTSIEGGKSKNGYPDSGYLRHLAEVLKSQGVEDI